MRKQRINIKKIHEAPTLLLIAGAILLVGCRAESSTLVSFDTEGRATVEARMLLDDEAAAFVGRQSDTPEDVAATLAASLGSGTAGFEGVTDQVEVEDLTGVAVTFGDLGPSDISAILTDSSSVIDRVTITVDGGVMRFDALAEPALEDDTRRLVATAPANIRDIVGMVLILEAPGPVIAHNADRAEGKVLQWDLLPAVLDRKTVEPFAEVSIPAGFVLSADRGPGDGVSTESTINPEVGESTPAWVWVVPLFAGLGAWIVLARRAADGAERDG